MTCFIATLRIKKGREAEFERLQRELSELTHAQEPDTHVYDIIRHRTDRAVYVVSEFCRCLAGISQTVQ